MFQQALNWINGQHRQSGEGLGPGSSGDQVWHIRPPDLCQEKSGLFLHVWGPEGYWHIVDGETHELLQMTGQPVTLADLVQRRPEWGVQREMIAKVLRKVTQGLAHTAPPTETQIENVSLNLTQACNLHCATCYLSDRERSPQKLDADAVIYFLEKLGSRLSRAASISLLGGEPFLNPEGVLAMAEWAQRRRLSCNVSTNGTVPLGNVIPQIRRAGLRVQVSLDGAAARTNDAIRGVGSYERALNTAQALIAGKIHTTLCMVACRENLAELGDYLRLARRIGASEARILPLKRLGNAEQNRLEPAPQLAILQGIAAELAHDPSLETLLQSDLYAIMRNLVRDSSRRGSCGSGTQTLLVQPDGGIFPCANSTWAEGQLGTVKDAPESVVAKGAQWGAGISIDKLSHPCYACVVKRWCLAGCPGETQQREGALRNRHWNCADLKESILFMMWQNSAAETVKETGRTRL